MWAWLVPCPALLSTSHLSLQTASCVFPEWTKGSPLRSPMCMSTPLARWRTTGPCRWCWPAALRCTPFHLTSRTAVLPSAAGFTQVRFLPMMLRRNHLIVEPSQTLWQLDKTLLSQSHLNRFQPSSSLNEVRSILQSIGTTRSILERFPYLPGQRISGQTFQEFRTWEKVALMAFCQKYVSNQATWLRLGNKNNIYLGKTLFFGLQISNISIFWKKALQRKLLGSTCGFRPKLVTSLTGRGLKS